MKKRILSLLLIVVMLCSLLPMTALAEEPIPAADAEIYITVSNQGVLAQANDGSAMVNKTVTVSDLNSDGVLTVDEALKAAHNAYSTAAGYVSEAGSYGLSVTKLWGVETANTLFFINGSGLSMGVGTDTVKAGDMLFASVNADNVNWADWYTSFNQTAASVVAGEELTLTLTGGQGMGYPPDFTQAVKGVKIGLWNNGSFEQIDTKVTGDDGKCSLSFAEAGTYIVTAKGTVTDQVDDYSTYPDPHYVNVECPIMAPACIVTVSAPVTAMVDFTAQAAGAFLCAPQFGVEVSSNLAELYGYQDSVDGVSALDVLVKAHELLFEDAFTKDTKGDYLAVPESGYISKLFGTNTSANGFILNGGYPNDGTESPYGGYNGTTVTTTAVSTGDSLNFFIYQDQAYWSDSVTYIDTDESVMAGSEFEVCVTGMMYMGGYQYATPAAMKADADEIEYAQLAWVDATTGALTDISGAVTNGDGKTSITAPAQAGAYYLTAYMPADDIEDGEFPLVMTPKKITVTAPGFLSALDFGVKSTAADKGTGVTLTPAFDQNVYEYTLTVPDTASSVYVWATLSTDGAGNTIKANYTSTGNAAKSVTVTSAKTTGAGLTAFLSAGKFTGNTLTVAVGTQEYHITVNRNATLTGITVTNAEEKTLTLDPAFAATVTEYTVNTLAEGTLTFAATPKVTGAQVGGLEDLTFTEASWTGTDPIDRVITVSGEGAVSTEYTIHFQKINPGLEGKGTAADPFLLKTAADLSAVSGMVADGTSFDGVYFKMTADITLPDGWVPLGTMKPGKTEPAATANNAIANVNPFSGNIDGDGHTLTVPTDGLPLIGFAYEASVKNLNIYGEQINGYGLVNNYHITGSTATCITIENVTLKTGTKTKNAGLIGGYSSGTFKVYIRNCTAESGVEIGYTRDQKWIGSFAGEFNGEISGCVSHADVYGTDFVGGIVADQGQSMTEMIIRDCIFDGNVTGTGNYVGGILGHGYGGTGWGFANNSCFPTVQNCICTGIVIGDDYVGGIFGAEIGSAQVWENGTGYIQNNYFGGTLTAAKENSGAIIGALQSIDRYTVISNNYYLQSCGAAKGIGTVTKIDDSEKYGRSDVTTETATETMTSAVAAVDATFVNTLNSGLNSNGDWVLNGTALSFGGAKHIVSIGTDPTLRVKNGLAVNNGTELNSYNLVVKYSDGTEEIKPISAATMKNYDLTTVHNAAAELLYSNHQMVFMLDVKTAVIEPVTPPDTNITVYFTLLGDDAHDAGDVHTLKAGNLTTWIEKTSVTVPAGSCVTAVLTKALGAAEIPFVNTSGNYVSSINGLAEMANGRNSGWMYTINDKHPLYGVSEQQVADGDNIVFHWTDDYTQEQGGEEWNETPTSGAGTTGEKSSVITPNASVKNGEAAAEVTAKEVTDAITAANKDDAAAIVVEPVVKGDADKVSVVLPTDAVEDIVEDTDADLVIRTEGGEVRIPNDTLAEVVKEATGDEIIITIEETDAADAKAKLPEEAQTEKAIAVSVTITSGGKEISTFGGKTLEVLIPVDTKIYEEGKTYTAYIISKDGSVEETTATIKDGYAVVIMSHFSTVIITKEEAVPFTDINGHWAYDAILYAYHNGLMNGIGDEKFDPNGTLNRAMLVTILYRLEGKPAVTAVNPFDDVKDGKWYTDAIIWAADNELVNGYGNGKFGPEDDITREQMAKILFAYSKLKGYDSSKANDLAAYTDAENISGWALDAVKWANAVNLITGRTETTIVPGGNATRAEAATILMRYMENVVK